MKPNSIVKIKINFSEGKKEVDMIVKHSFQLQNCDSNKLISLQMTNGTVTNGYFKSMNTDSGNMIIEVLPEKKETEIDNYYVKKLYFESVS